MDYMFIYFQQESSNQLQQCKFVNKLQPPAYTYLQYPTSNGLGNIYGQKRLMHIDESNSNSILTRSIAILKPTVTDQYTSNSATKVQKT